ncbi:MAG TPA: gluconokinase [Candidatus Binatia bacterium]|nr:gluconokinase [Candidatus Binatia bacterium]
MIVVLMGVEGSGKTTLGRLLASQLGWTFVEGDEFHPPTNVEKMHRGEPLTDADRAPWLRALRTRIDELVAAGRSAAVACSALKQSYRDVLASGRPEVVFVYLTAAPAVLRDRLRRRRGHFMPPGLLASQLATLEEPAGVLAVDVTSSPAQSVAAIRHGIGV